MTRHETEEKIMEHLQAIVKLYHEYNPGGNYLAMTLHKNMLSVHNEHWAADSDRSINRFVVLGRKDDGGVAL